LTGKCLHPLEGASHSRHFDPRLLQRSTSRSIDRRSRCRKFRATTPSPATSTRHALIFSHPHAMPCIRAQQSPCGHGPSSSARPSYTVHVQYMIPADRSQKKKTEKHGTMRLPLLFFDPERHPSAEQPQRPPRGACTLVPPAARSNNQQSHPWPRSDLFTNPSTIFRTRAAYTQQASWPMPADGQTHGSHPVFLLSQVRDKRCVSPAEPSPVTQPILPKDPNMPMCRGRLIKSIGQR
jgi:hypothetical protein